MEYNVLYEQDFYSVKGLNKNYIIISWDSRDRIQIIALEKCDMVNLNLFYFNCNLLS